MHHSTHFSWTFNHCQLHLHQNLIKISVFIPSTSYILVIPQFLTSNPSSPIHYLSPLNQCTHQPNFTQCNILFLTYCSISLFPSTSSIMFITSTPSSPLTTLVFLWKLVPDIYKGQPRLPLSFSPRTPNAPIMPILTLTHLFRSPTTIRYKLITYSIQNSPSTRPCITLSLENLKFP